MITGLLDERQIANALIDPSNRPLISRLLVSVKFHNGPESSEMYTKSSPAALSMQTSPHWIIFTKM
jgi:hypothetical protein